MEESTKHENIDKIIAELPLVNNMEGNSGQVVKNQFIIYGVGWSLFQSYSSPIALMTGGTVYLFKNWDYSVTTGKYRNKFLGETKKETLAKLKSGEYVAIGFEVIK